MLVLVRSQELCARTMTMEDAYQVKITLQSCASNGSSNFTVPRAALRATHVGYMIVYYVKIAVRYDARCCMKGILCKCIKFMND